MWIVRKELSHLQGDLKGFTLLGPFCICGKVDRVSKNECESDKIPGIFCLDGNDSQIECVGSFHLRA